VVMFLSFVLCVFFLFFRSRVGIVCGGWVRGFLYRGGIFFFFSIKRMFCFFGVVLFLFGCLV